jgi:hypothetical protein
MRSWALLPFLPKEAVLQIFNGLKNLLTLVGFEPISFGSNTLDAQDSLMRQVLVLLHLAIHVQLHLQI